MRLALILQTICSTGIRVSELEYITFSALKRQEAQEMCIRDSPWDGHERLEPPAVPERYNPVGCYVRGFAVPQSWDCLLYTSRCV